MHPFTSKRSDSIAALGEQSLIVAIRRWLGSVNPAAPAGIGDDCAVLPRFQRPALITVDPLVFGRHFDGKVAPRAAGAKLVKRNVSDIAAMGGRPRSAVVSLLVDSKTKTRWLAEFYRGMAATARRYGVTIVGGDVAQTDGVFAASLTLLGEAGSRVLTRRGARVGDWIYVTGRLGNSLRSGHHLTFVPRLAEGQWLAERREVRSLMDLSDGLAKDLRALTPEDAVPAVSAAALPLRGGADVRAALEDGEDYELAFTVAARVDRHQFEGEWKRRFPRVELTNIGRFEVGRRLRGAFVPVRASSQRLSNSPNKMRPGAAALPGAIVDLSAYRGYEHLR